MATRTTAGTPTTTTYRAPTAAGTPDLSGLPVETEIGVEEVLETERYDTPDLRLGTSGITLAMHRSATEAHWRLDLPDAVEGEQLRVPATPPDVEGVDQDVPAELLELVHGVGRGEPVRPVGRIKRVRVRESLRVKGREVGELVRDVVQLATLGSRTSVENWSEIAVTVSGGPADLPELVASRLLGYTPTVERAETTLDQLLRADAPAPPARRTAKKDAGTLLRYLGAQADRLATEDLRARRDEPDAVHQLRVAARRLRSALQAYPGFFTGPRPAALIEELRWLGRALASSRDLEVQEERIATALRGLPPEIVLGPVQAQVTRHFARSRAEARAAALTALDGDRYAALRGALEHFLQDPPLGGKAKLKAGLVKSRKRFDHRMSNAVAAVRSGEPADVAIHDARKAGKRLRYAVEVTGTKSKHLKGVARMLGEHQDTVVAREMLRELGAQAHLDGENGFTFGILHGRATRDAERIEETLVSR